MKRPTLSLIIFSVLFFLVLALLFSLTLYNAGQASDNSESYEDSLTGNARLDRGNGAVINIWIDSFSRLDALKNHKVKYLFVDIGDTGKDGAIKTPESEIKSFLDFMAGYETEKNYDFVLLPYSEIITDRYDINSEVFKDNFVRDYVNLNKLGFDGILVDIEKLDSEEKVSYIDLVERLRRKLPDTSIISVYAGALGSPQNEWEWDSTFYRSVSERVDLVSASGYDSDLVTAEQYKNYITNQVDLIISEGFSSYFLFAVPTHKGYPENIENALVAYTSELEKHPKNRFLGVCVFAEWTSDENDWKTFEKYINN